MFKLKSVYKILINSSILLSSMTFAEEMLKSNITITKDIKHDISVPLRYLHTPSFLPKFIFSKTSSDLAINNQASLVPLKGFQGLGVGLGNYQVTNEKPDPVASVGMSQYVQWVNNDIAIFDKATGELVPGFPKPANTLWSGFGGACEQSNIGHATVKYDQLVQRWVFS